METKKCNIKIEAQDVVYVVNHVINYFDNDPTNDIVQVIPFNNGEANWEFQKPASHALVIVGTGRPEAKVIVKIEELSLTVELKVRKNRRLKDVIGFIIV